ncbi:Demethylsterigmatocystin 6-O-methyltransferase [Penicillium rolfsii]|nr:Demethylsterigmatocystin 6-O-methyltransferase [Penicillium rolfsii]
MRLLAPIDIVISAAPDAAYLIKQLKFLIESPEVLSHDDSRRAEIQYLTRLASMALETPQESMQRIMFTHLPLVTARLSHEFSLLTTLLKGDSINPVALADLTKASGLDKSLVSAIMDYHCYHSSAIEPRQGFYTPTKLTHNLLDPKVVTTLTCWHDILRLAPPGPDYLDDSGKKTAFQITQNTMQRFYDWLESRPEQHASFFGYMAAVHAVTTKWTDVVNFDQEFTQDMQAKEVVFVDVGGGNGSQCLEVQKAHKLEGRIIMQDCGAVVEEAEMAREAGFVLLNWTDDDCVLILTSHAPAMGSDSVLIIVDYELGHRWETKDKLPEPELWTPAAALAARACHNAVGRSGADYRELLERASLELTEIRVFTKFGQAVIMAKKRTIARLSLALGFRR